MEKATISVVIPSYQARETIQRAIESVIHDQMVSKVFVMDDGSSDGTEALVKSLPYEKLIFEGGENRGACHARNRGLRLSTDEYVLFLDADDYVESGYLEQFRELMGNLPDLIIAGHRHIDSNGNQINAVTYDINLCGWELLAEYINNPIQTSGFLWNRAWLLDGGGWDETLPIFQDAEISIRMLLRKPMVSIIAEPERLAVWAEHGAATRITNNISHTKISAMYRGLLLHKNAIVKTDNSAAAEGLARRLYELARKAYARKFDEIGDLCIAAVRDLGINGHIGSYGHRLLSGLIGLKAKMHLVGFAKGLVGKTVNSGNYIVRRK
jgi:glycosyltransferase involved in cell wall biosynthesis